MMRLNMITEHLNRFISYKIGNDNLTKDFMDLLQYYDLTYEYGLKIQKMLLKYYILLKEVTNEYEVNILKKLYKI